MLLPVHKCLLYTLSPRQACSVHARTTFQSCPIHPRIFFLSANGTRHPVLRAVNGKNSTPCLGEIQVCKHKVPTRRCPSRLHVMKRSVGDDKFRTTLWLLVVVESEECTKDVHQHQGQ